MILQDQIVAALATAAAAIVTALGSWATAWIRRKVLENERANTAIAAQGLANGGTMVRLGVKLDGLHDTINGGQIPSIIEMLASNSAAVKTLMVIAERNSSAIVELKKVVAGLSHAPGERREKSQKNDLDRPPPRS